MRVAITVYRSWCKLPTRICESGKSASAERIGTESSTTWLCNV